MKRAAALFTCKARQLMRLFERTGSLFEEQVKSSQKNANLARERPLQLLAQGVPVRIAVKEVLVHPLIAPGEHGHDLVFKILPTVVAPQQ